MLFTKHKCSCKMQDLRIKELEDELNLEKTWAEGEIDFWKEECKKAEDLIAKLHSRSLWERIRNVKH